MTRINTFDEYQDLAEQTAIYPAGQALAYLSLGLGEAGEVQGKVKKIIRDGPAGPSYEDVAKELGDLLWYVANLAGVLGYNLSDIAGMNIDKLFDRKERGVLQGSGDNR
jgi:NTP pyrophosphatase (non-canonical NTP hydrolase)